MALSLVPAAALGLAAPTTTNPLKPYGVAKKSQAIPFLENPPHCDGTYAGDHGFDPLGLGGAYNIKYMKEAELKHGRICMLAFYGYVAVDAGLYAPGAPHVSSLMAHDTTVKTGHMLALLFVIATVESLGYSAINEMLSGQSDRKPGDYGFDPLGFSKDPEKAARYAAVETAHCRGAMLAFSGVVTASAMFEKPFPYF